MRLFFAIDLSHEVKTHLASVPRDWIRSHSSHRVAWAKPDNLHLTMKFLGEVDDATMARLLVRLKDLPRVGPFPLQTGAIDYFPSRGPIRIVAVQLDGDTDRIHQLVDSIETLCELEGFPRERRPFKPHITIGRSRSGLPGRLRPSPADPLWPPPSPPFTVTDIVLYESLLKPAGPEYIKLATFPL